MTFPGPEALGRGVIVRPGRALPAPFDGWPRVRVEEVNVDTADVLHEHWLRRAPVVVELAIDADALRAPEVDRREPWQVPVEFEFTRERLQFLVWRNNWDWRGDEPVWWWDRKAARLGAGPDVVVDGGPRQPLGFVVVHAESIEAGRLTPARHAPPSAELAPDQLAAVAHDVGPARVIAPAGSGKTRVLTARLRHLLADRGWDAEGIAAFAYNKRAADEMAERTSDLGAHIRTLNSLGLAICNRADRLQTIEEPEVRRLLDQLIELKRAVNTDPYAPYLEGLRAIRLGLADPAVVEREVGAEGLADLFPRFRQLLADKRLVDFDGQLYEALATLLTNPAIRQSMQAQSRHLLVDEFQDLTPVHLVVLRLMAAPAYDVFGVGDDDQVIYGFSGASPRFLLEYGRFFPGAREYALEVNYRCPPAVVDSARHLLSYNERRIAKTIRAADGGEGTFAVRRVPAVEEAAAVADAVTAWNESGEAWSDMAALARVNAALLPVQVLFTERGIPSRRPIDASILTRTGIRTALAYLRIGVDPGRIAAADVLETIRRPSRRIARNVVEMLTRKGWTSLADVRRLASRLSGGDSDKLAVYEADLQQVVSAVTGGDAAAALRAVRVGIGLGGAMDVLDSARREADRSTHADDLLALEQVAALHPDTATFEAWLTDVLSRRSDGSDGPGVELSTVHRVKGREWDDVVVFGVSDELLPHRLASDEDEERRLLHVAITRGRHRVLVVADEDKPSPFVTELDGTRPRGERRVVRRAVVAPAVAPSTAPTTARGTRVVEALKTWRRTTAKDEAIQAYRVLSDAEIDGIAVRLPGSLPELAGCKGIGAYKLERYGDEILAVIESAGEGA
jgi:DNA helicase-2/ATP-dependent DNA helicase PcrA